MASKTGVGRWTKLFGQAMPFSREVAKAVEIGAQWSVSDDGSQRDIILDYIPGWLAPLWGSDADWLYIRRPEGVWKIRLPQDKSSKTTTALYIRPTDYNGDPTTLVGGDSIGECIEDMGGWIRGPFTEHRIDAAELDLQCREAVEREQLKADQLGGLLYEIIRRESYGLVVKAGDGFDQVPFFEWQDGWLLAIDRSTGWTVGFSLRGCEAVQQALTDGSLWLNFSNGWMHPFNANVKLVSSASYPT